MKKFLQNKKHFVGSILAAVVLMVGLYAAYMPHTAMACSFWIFDCGSAPRILTFTATPSPAPPGVPVVLAWTTDKADYCITGKYPGGTSYGGTKYGHNGSVSSPPITAETTYYLQCQVGSAADGTAIVYISDTPDPCPVSSFGSPWNSNSYLIYSGGKGSISNWYGRYCVTNYSGSALFIPMATPTEWNNFAAGAPALSVGIVGY